MNDTIKIKATQVGKQLFTAYNSEEYNIYVLEGGSRSGKTRSIIDFIIAYCGANAFQGKRILIARQKSTWCKASVRFDFLAALKHYNIYSQDDDNRSDLIYRLYGNEIWFGGLDDPQRIHGFETDIFWINEAIEATKDDFDQLEMRCKGFGILDYNPTETEHWIYSSVLSRPDTKFIHSTIFDNPFAPDNAKRKILSYEDTEINRIQGTVNKNKWEIYGLGKRAKIDGQVYTNYEFTSQPEIPPSVGRRWAGIDWGFTNDVTAIVEVGVSGNELWIHEICYKTQMGIADIVRTIKTYIPEHQIIADSADPRMISECQKAGINMQPVSKSPGSIKAGISLLQDFKLMVTAPSENIRYELKNYQFQRDRYTGKFLSDPIDDVNHGLDGIRYVCLSKLSSPNIGKRRLNINEMAKFFH